MVNQHTYEYVSPQKVLLHWCKILTLGYFEIFLAGVRGDPVVDHGTECLLVEVVLDVAAVDHLKTITQLL